MTIDPRFAYSALLGLILLSVGPWAVSAPVHKELVTLQKGVDPRELTTTITHLVGFGTRHTLSDTTSTTRGIGAARRWVQGRFETLSEACHQCLIMATPSMEVEGSRIPHRAHIENVIAIQPGSTDPKRVVVISAHLDSRVSDPMDSTDDAPGANDDASGVAAVMEAARVLSHDHFAATIVYAVLSGEEQGLYGGKLLAQYAREQGWQVEAVLNNDIIGNTHGQSGVVENQVVRVFSEGTKAVETPTETEQRRYSGGEVDSPSRSLARYMSTIATEYLKPFSAHMVYRTDRYDRGGDQVPMLAAGYPAVRVTEAAENYTRQHQDVRIEHGVHYGDVIDGVDFDYLAQVTRLDVLTLASLAHAPAPPTDVTLEGAVSADTTLHWSANPAASHYRVWWRDTTAPHWQYSREAGKNTQITLNHVVIDDWFFGVQAQSSDGYVSPIVYPGAAGSFSSPSATFPQ